MHSKLATAVIRFSLLPEIDNKHHLLHLWRFCMLSVRCVGRSCQYSGVWLLLGDKGECSPVKCKIACQGHGAGKEVLCKITTTFSWWLGRDAGMNVYLHNKHTNSRNCRRKSSSSMSSTWWRGETAAKSHSLLFLTWQYCRGGYGSFKNGRWTGMIADLRAQKADMAVIDMSITSIRQTAVDFTMPYMTTGHLT